MPNIIWQIYPLGFTGAPVRPSEGERETTPRLRHICNWLDYAAEIGADTILLNPIFESATHGYDTIDHRKIDTRLGTDEDFDHLVKVCREKNLELVLDGVFNHVAESHELATAGHVSGGDFEGHSDLLELDHSSPEVEDYVVDVMCHWLERGISGWRLDAVYATDPEFFARVTTRVRERFPHAWFVGEMIHGDYNDYVAKAHLDSITQYELWKAIWSSIKDRNFYELEWTLKRNAELTFTPMTFVGNHDTTRIASQVGEHGAAIAAVLLYTLPGIPAIYYGDEQGFTGVKEERVGGDDAVRPTVPGSPEELHEIGKWMYALHEQLGRRRQAQPWIKDAQVEITDIDNAVLAYRVFDENNSMNVRVELDPPRAEIDGESVGL
ncbi:alpha-amylase family glycosyl hydrolase [Corynebacterium sp. TAE3-ERU30]|uniref:alpha-amylase family glycosyl hydrolase n=1 Tax=Corynebacterium sp. TAE3-ERU30 TaxID=2849496 RepID=UPI001C44BF78|nr:alpha-amylase family glycosyl hydrolase [Corynebacterium sp. TAE3-ERU30]MBV7282495.1 alpha-amylase [Corynebacterium sp. TAE3-ERU30]